MPLRFPRIVLASLLFPSILAACQTTPHPIAHPRSVTDTVPDWDLGPADLVTTVSWTEASLDRPLPLQQEAVSEIARGTITADGTMDLVLPEILPADMLFPMTGPYFVPRACEGRFAIVPNDARGASLLALYAETDGRTIAELTRADTRETLPISTYELVSWLYVDRPLQITGTCATTGFPGTVTYDIDAPAGWSLLEGTVSYDEITDTSTAVAKTVGESSIPWIFHPRAPTPQPPPAHLPPGLRQTR